MSKNTITLQIPNDEILEQFQKRAHNEDIPWNILLNSVMKKYAEGSLVQKEEMYVVK